MLNVEQGTTNFERVPGDGGSREGWSGNPFAKHEQKIEDDSPTAFGKSSGVKTRDNAGTP